MKRTCKPSTLAAPNVPLAHKSGISATAAAHLRVEVAPYSDMEQGDLIELFWNNCFVASKRLNPGETGTTTHLRIPESFVLNGPARLHYRVMQVGKGPARSAITRLYVKLDCPGGHPAVIEEQENQALALLDIPETIRRHGVNRNQIRRGVPLTIEPYLNMSVEDEITLRWGDVRLDLPKLCATDVGKPIQVWVPPSIIVEAGDDNRLEVTYCILDRVGNNSRWAPARTLRIASSNPDAPVITGRLLEMGEPRRC